MALCVILIRREQNFLSFFVINIAIFKILGIFFYLKDVFMLVS